MIALRDVSKYSALSTALELRFGDENLKQVFAVKLKTTVHKVGESLQEFCSKCQKMVGVAYSATPPICDRIFYQRYSRR